MSIVGYTEKEEFSQERELQPDCIGGRGSGKGEGEEAEGRGKVGRVLFIPHRIHQALAT